jgi:hypothetical protein
MYFYFSTYFKYSVLLRTCFISMLHFYICVMSTRPTQLVCIAKASGTQVSCFDHLLLVALFCLTILFNRFMLSIFVLSYSCKRVCALVVYVFSIFCNIYSSSCRTHLRTTCDKAYVDVASSVRASLWQQPSSWAVIYSFRELMWFTHQIFHFWWPPLSRSSSGGVSYSRWYIRGELSVPYFPTESAQVRPPQFLLEARSLDIIPREGVIESKSVHYALSREKVLSWVTCTKVTLQFVRYSAKCSSWDNLFFDLV